MKRSIAILALIVCTLGQWVHAQHRCSQHRSARSIYPAPENLRSDTLDVLHYGIHLNITDFAGRTISGYTDVRVTPLRTGVNSISLDLLHLTVDSIVSGGNSLGFGYNDTLIVAQLPTASNPGDTFTVRVYYHGQPQTDLSGWGGFYFSGNYAFNLGVGFDAAPHNYGRVWYPCFDNFVERSTYDFYIRTADGRIATSNGIRQSVTQLVGDTIETHWRSTRQIPTYLVSVAVAPYAEVQDQYTSILGNSIPMSLFALAGDTNSLKASFVNLPAAMQGYETAFGPYLFEKVGYSIVPFNGGAMEHAGNIAYPRNAIDGTTTRETLMAHELSHHWWGNLATCETQEDMWLNEGFASFCEILFLEQVYGWPRGQEEAKDVLFNVIRNAHVQEDGYRAVSGLPHQYTYGTHTYDKGALVTMNLRHYLGDMNFFDGLTDFLDENAFSSMNSAELRDHLETYSGIDLDPFFNGWVFNGGFPAFELDSVQLAQNEVTVFVEQKLRGTNQPFTNVPLTVFCYDANWNRSEHRIELIHGEGSATFQAPFQPVYVTLNADNRFAYATTDDMQVIDQTGTYNFEHTFMELDVQQSTDSSLVRIMHYWVEPDPVKAFTQKPFRLSDYRYWKVEGIWEPGFLASAEFFYDGRSSGGYLDSSLVSITEDSLVLLYRPNAAADWDEYTDYTKNVLGSSSNQFGVIQISNLRQGEYTLANRDVTVLGTEDTQGDAGSLRIFPNPAQHQVTFEYGPTEGLLTILDMQGRQVLDRQVDGSGRFIWDTSRLPQGTYSYVFRAGKQTQNGQLLIAR